MDTTQETLKLILEEIKNINERLGEQEKSDKEIRAFINKLDSAVEARFKKLER